MKHALIMSAWVARGRPFSALSGMAMISPAKYGNSDGRARRIVYRRESDDDAVAVNSPPNAA